MITSILTTILIILGLIALALVVVFVVIPALIVWGLVHSFTATPTVPVQPPAIVQEYHAPSQISCAPFDVHGNALLRQIGSNCYYENETAAPQYSAPSNSSNPPYAETNTVSFTCNGKTLTFGAGSVLFPFNVFHNDVAVHDCRYDAVFDTSQSGYAGVNAYGWLHQPWLPGENREYHEGAVIVPESMIRYLGPECRVYRNTLGTDATGGFNGQLLLNRANGITDISMSATPGHGNEVWLWVSCLESEASGFSMSAMK